MFSNLFKLQSYYVFNYKPRFYSERKERIATLQKESSKNRNSVPIDSNTEVRLSRHLLRKEWKREKKSTKDKRANRRLAIIIAILVGIVAYLLELHTFF